MEATAVTDNAIVKLETLQARAGINLDVGCGPHKQIGPGWVGIDIRALPGVDLVHDLWTFPWPVEADSVNLLLMAHYLEHVPPHLVFPTMAEVHRVCRHGAQVMISGPYGLGYRWQQDPSHATCWVENSFAYWDPTLPRELPVDDERKGNLWAIYRMPVLHMMTFSRVPAGGDADFNAALIVCKDSDDCRYCAKGRRA